MNDGMIPRERPAEEAGTRVSRKWHCFAVAALSAFMGTLDSSIVNVALPTLGDEFLVDVRVVAWTVQSYLLVSMAFLLIGGRLLDFWGPRSVFVAGFLVFTLGSALCSASTSIYMLILSRALQGLGASMLMGANQGLIAHAFPESQRGRTLGLIAIVVSVGLATGPSLGGKLIEWFGWRSIFYINIPVGAGAILYCLRFLSAEKPRREESGFDWSGAALIVVGLSALFLGLTFGEDLGWGSAEVLVLLSSSLVILFLFLFNEQKSSIPILPLSLFRRRYFTQSCAATYLAFFSMISSMILMPFYMQKVLGFEPGKMGLVMMTLPGAMLLVAPLGGWASDHIGSRIPASTGLALIGTGLVLLSGLGIDSGASDVVWRLALVGLGMGFFGSPNSNAILSSVPKDSVGIASGLCALMRTSGIAFGIAFSATAFTFFRDRAAQGGDAGEVMDGKLLFLNGIKPVFILAAVIVGLNILNSLSRGRRPVVE